MTLILCVANPDGLVIAGDSRQTSMTNTGLNRIASDNGQKVFELTPSCFAATSGWAFLPPHGSPILRNISTLIDDFRTTIPPAWSIQDTATNLQTYFDGLYQSYIAQAPAQAVPAGQVALDFIVGGYNTNTRVGEVYRCQIPGAAGRVLDTNNPSAFWGGQWDVVARIMNGYDPRLLALPFVQQAVQGSIPPVQPGNPPQQPQTVSPVLQSLSGLGYVVDWSLLTLQDSVNFATAMIQITTIIQRFTNGIRQQPGDVPGVGGPIDVAVCTGPNAFRWLAKKELHV